MEKTTVVTFKGDDREIQINFLLNGETGDIQYNVMVDPPFETEEEITQGGLTVFLANMLLNAMSLPTEDEIDEIEDEPTDFTQSYSRE